jgi:hypothetical protein
MFLAALLSMLILGFHPGTSQAKRHRRARRVTHTRVVYRTAPAPRSHGLNGNANVGVGLGPIHIGVGGGAGVGVHERAVPPSVPAGDPIGYNNSTSSHVIPAAPPLKGVMAVLDVTSSVIPAAVKSAAVHPTSSNPEFSQDTTVNNYYYAYAPPKTVTVGGFNVAVVGNSHYFSPFKHHSGMPMFVHNNKGVDQTAAYGESTRAGSLPTSFGVGYIETTIPARQ